MIIGNSFNERYVAPGPRRNSERSVPALDCAVHPLGSLPSAQCPFRVGKIACVYVALSGRLAAGEFGPGHGGLPLDW